MKNALDDGRGALVQPVSAHDKAADCTLFVIDLAPAFLPVV
ncbi:hypothetical protein AB0I84_41670 [Streptomyces spectabilis]